MLEFGRTVENPMIRTCEWSSAASCNMVGILRRTSWPADPDTRLITDSMDNVLHVALEYIDYETVQLLL